MFSASIAPNTTSQWINKHYRVDTSQDFGRSYPISDFYGNAVLSLGPKTRYYTVASDLTKLAHVFSWLQLVLGEK